MLRYGSMTPRALLRTLSSLARRVGVDVREEELSPLARARGGICRVNGKTIVVVDPHGSHFERACMVAKALSTADLSGISLPPDLETFIRLGPKPPRVIPREKLRPLAKARLRLRVQLLAEGSTGTPLPPPVG